MKTLQYVDINGKPEKINWTDGQVDERLKDADTDNVYLLISEDLPII